MIFPEKGHIILVNDSQEQVIAMKERFKYSSEYKSGAKDGVFDFNRRYSGPLPKYQSKPYKLGYFEAYSKAMRKNMGFD